jgi:hypothetical protein
MSQTDRAIAPKRSAAVQKRNACDAMALPSHNRFGVHRISGNGGRLSNRCGQDFQMELPV